ncbi:patatin-like phospholipase family protein [Costertonia aggregata]|uniref:Patatin-like phospholipase family protein n=1 Tax=Costertonia aggregata TaxID=343403 RepID=A0A7H9AQ42_9FLAO|nr:patatin-like phospholipase family protein [Costertonia aggregata]QLG45558.1 patatin-like phospholipase family protein [Costertonia aggregata]
MRQIPILIVTFLLSTFCFSQHLEYVGEKGEVKVGLVLSGGGAKGLAHIGALKIIEDAGVKIDYIGGTSMGAIVGALYASGYSAKELDSIFRSINFTELIQDNLPRSAKTFYEKDDSERYALTLPFENFKISFPSAISGGQNIYNELVRLLYHVKDVRDFKELPIPFFCIATNIETGEEVLLNKGYLPEAILASGTFPSLFEPTEIEGKILIDGGVVNNYPVEEVKDLGANFIIGVDVQHGLSERGALMSATEILLQINNYRTVNDMVEKVAQTDIYIKPDIEKYSVIDFDLGNEIVKSGEVAGENKFDELKQLAMCQKGKTTTTLPINPKDTIIVNRLIIRGNNNYTRGYVKGKLRFKLAEKITFEKLQQGIGNLSATGNFQTIRYELVSNELGVDLILKLKENPTKAYIRLGAHYDDLYKSAALINLTKKNLFFKDDVISFDFIAGDNIRYNFQYYLDKGSYWSFGVNSRFNDFERQIDFDVITSNFDVPANPNVNTVSIDVDDITNQVYLQTVLREEFAFTLGVEHKLLKYSTKTLADLEDDTSNLALFTNSEGRTFFENSNYFSAYGQLVLDTYDDKYFPSRGLYFNGDFHFYILSSDFNNNFKEFSVSKARLGTAFPITKNVSLNIETEGGFKLGTSNVTSFDFVLGGYGNDFINNFIPFFGYDFISLPGNAYVKTYARLDYEFLPKNHLTFAANYANVDDDIFRTGEWFTAPDFSGYAIGYGWESFLGPVQINYSWSPEVSENNVFISVGYWF